MPTCCAYYTEGGVWKCGTTQGFEPSPPKPTLQHVTETPMATTSRSWADLPQENVENILRWLGRDELKYCRLVDKRTGVAATRCLFRTVNLSPSMTSVNRLTSIASQPTLAGLVRSITVSTHFLVDDSFERLVRSGLLCRRLDHMQPVEAAAHALRLSWEYGAEVHAQSTFPTQGPAKISHALAQFTRIHQIIHTRPTIRNPMGFYELGDDSDLVRRTGVNVLDGTKQYPLVNSVLQKCRHLRPLSIDLRSIYWWEFYNISEIPHLRDLLSKVKQFKLTFQAESLDRPKRQLDAKKSQYWAGIGTYLERLPAYLPEVEDLTLGHDTLPPKHDYFQTIHTYALTRLTTLLLQSPNLEIPYPKLKHLVLENLATNLNDLCEFILRHANTLESLTLLNMCIDGAQTPGTETGILESMIVIITFLREHLQLQSMSFQGDFKDHKGATLICSLRPGENILHGMEEYVCHRKNSAGFVDYNGDVSCFAALKTIARISRIVYTAIATDASWHLEPEFPPRPRRRGSTSPFSTQLLRTLYEPV